MQRSEITSTIIYSWHYKFNSKIWFFCSGFPDNRSSSTNLVIYLQFFFYLLFHYKTLFNISWFCSIFFFFFLLFQCSVRWMTNWIKVLTKSLMKNRTKTPLKIHSFKISHLNSWNSTSKLYLKDFTWIRHLICICNYKINYSKNTHHRGNHKIYTLCIWILSCMCICECEWI